MRYFVTLGNRTLEVELGPDGITLEGERIDADLVEMDGTEVRSLLMSGRSHRVLAARKGRGEWSLHLSGQHYDARVVDERTRSIEEMTGSGEGVAGPKALKAPMPGLVVKVEVAEGDLVTKGQGLVIVEAMKMENELKCGGEAVVRKVLIVPGEAVEKDQVLMEFDPVGKRAKTEAGE